jgi:hypothetical protein
MDDALLVRGFQCFRDLRRDAQRLLQWNRAAFDLLGESLSADKFHDQKLPTASFLHPVW